MGRRHQGSQNKGPIKNLQVGKTDRKAVGGLNYCGAWSISLKLYATCIEIPLKKMAAASLSLGTLSPFHGSAKISSRLTPDAHFDTTYPKTRKTPRKSTIVAATEGSAKSKSSEPDEEIPSWAKPDSAEPPPWARGEGQESTEQTSSDLPFYVYLLASAVTAIAAIGSVFEYANEKPVFGVVYPDSIFYTPLLGFFAFTGIPTSAFLWFKSVEVANKEAEEQDRRDGYR